MTLGGCAAEGTSAATGEKPVSHGATSCAQGSTLGFSVSPRDPRFSPVSLRCLLPHTLLARRASCSSLLALFGAFAPGLHAQTPAPAAPPAAPTATLAPATDNAEAPTDAGYQDRVIEGLAPLDDDEGGFEYDKAGWPRFLRLETRLGTQPFDTERKTQTAFAVYGLLDTPNHGALSLDGSLTPRESRGTLTLRQRGLPLASGWIGNHEAGVITAPAPGITRLPSRVYLPSATLRGLAGEWLDPASGLTLQAGSGEPGQMESLPASGFRGLGGRRTTLGAQWHLGASPDSTDPLGLPGWTLALQHEDASRVTALGETRETGTPLDARSTLVALRHEGDSRRTQGQLILSRNTATPGETSNPQGFWIDSEWDDGPRQHGIGLYRLDPGLSWAGQAMPSDVQGATLRSEWRTRQWSAEGSVDWLRSISGRTRDGSYASGSARWRLSRASSLGAGASVRHFDGDAWSSYGDWRWQNPLGTSGLRLTLSGGAASQTRSQAIGYDQDWTVPQGWSVSTSFGLTRNRASTRADGSTDTSGNPDETLWSAALAFTAPLSGDASLRGTLQTEQGNNGQHRHGINLGSVWRVNQRWSLEGNYTRSLGQSRTVRPLDPLAPIVTDTPADNDRSFYAVLRYELQAGSRSVPLGGRPSEGGGRIAGVVYFDANRSGTQEASETGAPGVTVYLDNRYAVRTDAQGRFEFPFVASGPRTVSVRNETLPLPWSVVDEGQAKVDVRLRETTQLSLPVQRAD
jgi:hypothetical protein